MGYYICTKTTLDIADNILRRAKRVAKRDKVTLRSLTEEGLEKILKERESPRPVAVKPVTFKGKGLSPEFQGTSWTDIRNAAYEGHGG